MKYLLICLALMPLAMSFKIQEIAEVNDRSISSQIIDFIEACKLQMPCGFPGLGIPPLAPVKISHKEVNITTKSFKAAGEIDKFRLDGLNDFEVRDFKVNALLSRINFKFIWNHVYLNTDYEMSTSLDDAKVMRSGNAKMSLKNATVWGTIKYSLGVLSGNLRLKSFDLYISLDEVQSEIGGLSKYKIINKKLNQVIEEWIMLAVNDNTENISQLTNGYVVPLANNLIGDMGLSELLGLIGGGGGGESESAEKVPCVPEDN